MSKSRAIKYAQKALAILNADEKRLRKVDEYHQGQHVRPYTPRNASQEYRDLAERAVTNWMPNLVETPTNALFVDNIVRDEDGGTSATATTPEWAHWNRSTLNAIQHTVHYTALEFGHSFTCTEIEVRGKYKGKAITRGLSPLRTVALYQDARTDIEPVAAVYFRQFDARDALDPRDGFGIAHVWDDQDRYTLHFKGDEWVCKEVAKHGASVVPVTRFITHRDLEGRTWGVIEPMIPIQDRVNQTIFDLLIAQTYTSFVVRTVSGMAPPMKMRLDEDTGEQVPVLDENGNPIPDQQKLDAARWFYAEDPDVKFGSLPAGELTGFIAAAELAIQHLSALSSTPPHFLLGQIANISAEAMEAAETALSRKVEAFQTSFGESWERVMRIAAELEGEASADDLSLEVVWRDMGAGSLAQSADALGKFSDSLGIPKRGLWGRVPKVTKGELTRWEELRREDDIDGRLADQNIGRIQPLRQPARTTTFGATRDSEVTHEQPAAAPRGAAG